MKNEMKLGLIIVTILFLALGLGKFFHLSFNPETFQIGYTVYSDKGQEFHGFIPEKKIAAGATPCNQQCSDKPSTFAIQCRQEGHKVYAGTCCESLCSGNLASFNQGPSL